jgi:L-malate glycosyltransferase
LRALRVVILTPTALPNLTGNAITAERWRRSLSEKGLTVQVVETRRMEARRLLTSLEALQPDVVHAHHITRAGVWMLEPSVAEHYGSLPLIVSPAGTDIGSFEVPGPQQQAVESICRKARFIISQNPEVSELLKALLPGVQERIRYVKKTSSWLGGDPYDLRFFAGCRADDVLFFMPAGVRPVKGNVECLLAMEELHAANKQVRAVFAGPALDAEYATWFADEVRRLASFVTWIPQIPPTSMHSAYLGADVVLNYSRSEGLSNSLLEAVAAWRPILASDIPGNKWLVNDEAGLGPCACLFNAADRADFVRNGLLFLDPGYRRQKAAAARRRAANLADPSEEAQALLEIYRAAL